MKHLFLTVLLLVSTACINSNASLTVAEQAVLARIDFDTKVAIALKSEFKTNFTASKTEIFSSEADPSKPDSKMVINNAITFEVDQNMLQGLINKHYKYYKSKSYLIFKSESNFGHGKDKITVLKSTDQFDMLRAMQTNGINYNLDTSAVIAQLQQWHKQYPFQIIGAGNDWVEATFDTKPKDMDSFAKAVYAVCPDVVDQGTNTVQALAEEMNKSNTLYLWWD